MAEVYYNLGVKLCVSIDKLTEKVGELIDIEKGRDDTEKERNNILSSIKQGLSDLTAIQTKYAFGFYLNEVDSESKAGVQIQYPELVRNYDGTMTKTDLKISYNYYDERKHNNENEESDEQDDKLDDKQEKDYRA